MRRIAFLGAIGFMVLGFIPLLWAAPAKSTKSRVSASQTVSQNARYVEAAKIAEYVKEAAANGIKIDSEIISAIEDLGSRDASFALRVYYMAIDGYQMLNQPQKSLEMLDLAVKAFPKQADLATRMVAVYQQQGQTDKAIALIRQLAKANPENTAYQHMLASSYMANGNKEEALVVYRDLADSRSDDPEAQLRYGQMLLSNGRPEEAIGYFESASKLKPQDLRYMQQLAQAFTKAKKYNEASKVYGKVLSISKEPWQVRDAQQQILNLAVQQKSLGSFIEGVEASLKKDPKNINNYWILVDAYAADNKPARVLSALERTMKQFPEDPEVRSRLVGAYQGQGKMDKAVDMLKEMIAANPRDIGLKIKYAQAQIQAGKSQDAVTTYEQLASADPKNPVYREQIAEIYARANQKDKAIKEYEGLLRSASEDWRRSSYSMRIEQLKQEGRQAVSVVRR